MKTKFNGKAILLLALVLACALALSATDRQINLSPAGNDIQLSDNNDLGFNVQFKVGELNIREIQTKEGLFDELFIEGWSHSNAIGEPKLPMLRKIIAVPVSADVRYSITSQSERQLGRADNQLSHRIIPAQASISKSEDPEKVPFIVKEAAYSLDRFTEVDYIRITEIGYMRGVRIFALDYHPVRYNPSDNSITVMEDISVSVTFDHPDLFATAELLAKTGSYEFDKLYAQSIFNWQADTRTSIVRYPTKYLILCPPNYTNTLQPFVDWKKQQGYNVIVTTVGSGGSVANTTTAINTYMAGVWAAATIPDPAPTYLLIVGDTSTSGDNVIANTGSTGTHPTDLNYVRLQGTDYVPEMYYGRFSVSSAAELTNIVNKTMTFQKTQMSDLSYLGNVVMIAGVDGSFGPTHGNGAINYGTQNYFNTAHGINSNTYLYPASGSSDAAIISNANAGRGYINYTAHGNETSWGDPTFTVSDVNSMTNTGKYGVMVGNCCLTNKFDYGVCFGESIIRKANAAGVIYIGGTNNTYWDEDYWWAVGAKGTANGSAPAYDATKLGVYDAMFHDHSEAFTDWAQTTGEVIWMGNLAVAQGNSSRTNYYWEIYSIMGDPSLMPYYGVPTANTASYPSEIMMGNTSYAITGAAPYSRIGLSMNGVIYGTGITNAAGNLTLTISPFTTAGTAKLVLTAQDKITLMADIPVVAAEGPYMTVDSVVYDDANNDLPDYNESGYIDVNFENVGVDPATSVSAVLTCSTPGVTITDGNHSIGSLAAGASVFADNAYAITIANNIMNGTVANFTITMVSGANSWVHNFSLTLNAPVLAFSTMTVSDPSGNNNGRLDPGETVTITIPLSNTGGAASLPGSATLTCFTTGITINTGTANFSAISAAGTANLSFSLTAASGMTVGTVAALVFNATAGAYTANKTENVAVGLIIEDFGTGGFSSFPWIMGGTAPWTTDNTTYYSAGYAAKSGTITHSQSSTMETTRILSSSGILTFWYKVSSETGYDFLKFYIDGSLQNQWSGTVDWTQASYTLSAGTRVLKWEYMKDGSVSTDPDCAWVDDIIFPASTTPSSFYPPQNLTAAPGNGFVNLTWQAPLTGTPTGYRIYRNSTLLTTVTGLSYTDSAVVNETSYAYYLVAAYIGGTSDPTATVTATPTAIVPTSVILGTGTASNGNTAACPINQYYRSLHGQSVYTATELHAAGVFGPIDISQIGFNITGLPAQAMPNFVVRMGHTTATDAASWISTGLTQMWSAASYLPTTTGWNMLTLSTPFTWNGTDNIVLDTAFGLIASYQSSGTTQYSTVTNGYRYNRSDSADQSAVFTNGSTATTRPNVKLELLPNESGPVIGVNPITLAYGDVAVGGNSVQQFTIQNAGDQTLTGTINTPTGYTVAEAVRSTEVLLASSKDSRDALSFSVNAGASKTYNLTFAPTSAIAYNGNVVITNNSVNNTSVNIALTGAGYIPATIGINDNSMYAYLQIGEEGTDSFTITNTGSQTLNYSISMQELRGLATGSLSSQVESKDRSITGSTLTLDATNYLPGTTVDWTFTVYNASTDSEWLKDIFISFPAGVTVNNATTFTGGTGGALIPDTTSGSDITINWHGESASGWGMIYGSESATATVNVTIGTSFGGELNLPFTLNGDVYGSEPHTLSGSIVLTEDVPPVEWCSAQPLSGSILSGQSQMITIYFSAIGMAPATYEAMLTVHSNDPVNPSMVVDLMMVVDGEINDPPTIDLPASFAFDKNGTLVVDMSAYTYDEEGDPLTLSCSGNTNVLVDITGLVVTFTAMPNWIGTENLTFTVNDGHASNSDAVAVTVNQVNMPDWVPVVYPNNSATVYGIATVDWSPCALNDVVGVFVGTECRGFAEVTMNAGTAYVTLLVNLASEGEIVSFQVFDHSTDTIYPVLETYALNFGQVMGDTTPVPINGSSVIELDTPVVTVSTVSGGMMLSWAAVPNADEYMIYRSLEPFGGFTLLATTSGIAYADTEDLPRAFYYVKAVQGVIAK